MFRHPAIWLAALTGWLLVLFYASTIHGLPHQPPPVPHMDKVMHFSYFLAGGFVFAGWIFWRNPVRPPWKTILAATIAAMAAIGALDEWHQTFTPGRSGNDPWDWLADLLGGTSGAFLLKGIHRRIQ